MNPLCASVTLVPPIAHGDVAGALTHAVAAIARPVRQHDVGDAAGARVSDERAQQEEVGPGREEVELAAVQIEAGQPDDAGGPRRRRHEDQRQDEEAAENCDDQHPVQQLERAFDAAAERQDRHASEERPDADVVDDARIGRGGELAREQEEDRAGGRAGPRRPSDLQEVEDGVDPRPERGRGTRAHEAGEHRLAGRQRVAHQLGVEDRLEEHGDPDHPEQRQPVTDERRRVRAGILRCRSTRRAR